MSNDDKCRVGIGVAAVGRQLKYIMRKEDPDLLPDHSFPVSNHKLIVSVYSVLTSTNKYASGDVRRLTYSGPTAVVVRSGNLSAFS